MLKRDGYPLPVSTTLIDLLEEVIQKSECQGAGYVINFSDPEYSTEVEGHYPVEVAINEEGRILYISIFAYVGQAPFIELAKVNDFDFSNGIYQFLRGDYLIEQGIDHYLVWEENLIFCYQAGAYKIDVRGL